MPDLAPKEICICAAIRLERGDVIRGHRHDACYAVARGWVEGGSLMREELHNAVQGFITSLNRFVNRYQGMELQRTAGVQSVQWPDGVLRGDMLFSEDLY